MFILIWSLVFQYVTNDWKVANVTPIHKKGAESPPSNYRPISLTSIPFNLMESILTDHVTDTKIHDEALPVDVLYLDFAEAFDTVPKRQLISKS